jgi:hypothetical protein
LRVLVSRVDQRFADIGALPADEQTASSIPTPTPPGGPPRARAAGANEVVYASVHVRAASASAFKPTAVGIRCPARASSITGWRAWRAISPRAEWVGL